MVDRFLSGPQILFCKITSMYLSLSLYINNVWVQEHVLSSSLFTITALTMTSSVLSTTLPVGQLLGRAYFSRTKCHALLCSTPADSYYSTYVTSYMWCHVQLMIIEASNVGQREGKNTCNFTTKVNFIIAMVVSVGDGGRDALYAPSQSAHELHYITLCLGNNSVTTFLHDPSIFMCAICMLLCVMCACCQA